MPQLQPGQLVTSTAGRDCNRHYLVYGWLEEGDFVLVVDGEKRTQKHPKRKNSKHLKSHGLVAEDVAARWAREEAVPEAEVQEAVQALVSKLEEAG